MVPLLTSNPEVRALPRMWEMLLQSFLLPKGNVTVPPISQ